MRPIHRIVVLATLVLIVPAISGCADFDLDKLDVFHLNEKKKLPGKRVLLFPNGVPGVSQGIPPEYMKGYQQQQDQAANATLQPGAAPTNAEAAKTGGQKAGEQRTAAVTPVESKPEPKPKPKPKPKRHVRRKVKHKVKATAKKKATEPKSVSQPQPAPWPAPQPQQGNTSPWPAAQPSTTTNSAWPAPPPSGTFSKQ